MAATVEEALGTGRRKTSTARVFMRPGKGEITVNERPLDVFFGRKTARMIVRQPLEVAELEGNFDIAVGSQEYLLDRDCRIDTPAGPGNICVNDKIDDRIGTARQRRIGINDRTVRRVIFVDFSSSIGLVLGTAISVVGIDMSYIDIVTRSNIVCIFSIASRETSTPVPAF